MPPLPSRSQLKQRATKLTSAILLTLVTTATAQAMPWNELQKEIYNVEKGKTVTAAQMAKLAATMDTAMIYTKALTAQGLTPLFCVPSGTAMQLEDVLSIISEQAQSQKANAKTPVGELLIRGFAARYPCKASQ